MTITGKKKPAVVFIVLGLVWLGLLLALLSFGDIKLNVFEVLKSLCG
ncbi:hypothetical protein [Lentilactobacillus farraginis]|nr:hypothetical protein [Lentilactobacillus farraginis]